MGRTYLFECAKCGYRAKVAGGADRGLHIAVQTIECLDCRDLYDVVTELKMPIALIGKTSRWKLSAGPGDADGVQTPAPRFPEVLNRLRSGAGQQFGWVRFPAVCPQSAFHRIREWNEPGRCPQCGVFLEGSAIPFKVWD